MDDLILDNETANRRKQKKKRPCSERYQDRIINLNLKSYITLRVRYNYQFAYRLLLSLLD